MIRITKEQAGEMLDIEYSHIMSDEKLTKLEQREILKKWKKLGYIK